MFKAEDAVMLLFTLGILVVGLVVAILLPLLRR
jgi:hypothetical protein